MENLKRIFIGGRTYPFRIDLNVLQQIQEEYGTINQFEREIMGLRLIKDEEGNQLYDEKGKALMELVEPSIRAIKAVLPLAINEGLAMEADEQNKPVEKVTEEFVIRNCTVGYDLLAEMLYEEFRRCFATKK